MEHYRRIVATEDRLQIRRAAGMAVESDAQTRPKVLADRKNMQQNVVEKMMMAGGDIIGRVVAARRLINVKKPTPISNASGASSSAKRHFEDVVIRCEPFDTDITNYLFEAEKKYGVAEGFLHGREVTPWMRSILVDWLVQVHQRFDFCVETLYLTFNLLDRYISRGEADKTNLQLIGITCLLLAAKYEEMHIPKLQEFAYITDGACVKKDILRMEIKVLKVVGVDLGRPVVIQFVRRLTEYFGPRVHAMSKYISENAASCYALCHLNPSVIAAVSVWIASLLEGRSFSFGHYRIARVPKRTVHKYVPQFASNLLRMHADSKLKAIRTKYASPKHLRVSSFAELQMEILRKLEGAAYVASLP